MQYAVCNMIVGNETKNLCFVNIAGIGTGMDNTISIKCESLTVAGSFFVLTADGRSTAGSRGGKPLFFLFIKELKGGKEICM